MLLRKKAACFHAIFAKIDYGSADLKQALLCIRLVLSLPTNRIINEIKKRGRYRCCGLSWVFFRKCCSHYFSTIDLLSWSRQRRKEVMVLEYTCLTLLFIEWRNTKASALFRALAFVLFVGRWLACHSTYLMVIKWFYINKNWSIRCNCNLLISKIPTEHCWK